jgi:hypothetical protein
MQRKTVSRAEAMQTETIVTCPHCGAQTNEIMPVNACVVVYDCEGCGATLKPRSGDCCVFCSYGTVPCPPIQAGASCCTGDTPAKPI